MSRRRSIQWNSRKAGSCIWRHLPNFLSRAPDSTNRQQTGRRSRAGPARERRLRLHFTPFPTRRRNNPKNPFSSMRVRLHSPSQPQCTRPPRKRPHYKSSHKFPMGDGACVCVRPFFIFPPFLPTQTLVHRRRPSPSTRTIRATGTRCASSPTAPSSRWRRKKSSG